METNNSKGFFLLITSIQLLVLWVWFVLTNQMNLLFRNWIIWSSSIPWILWWTRIQMALCSMNLTTQIMLSKDYIYFISILIFKFMYLQQSNISFKQVFWIPLQLKLGSNCSIWDICLLISLICHFSAFLF